MRLLTDHAQFYDALFDTQEPVFHRMAFTRGGWSKRVQFAQFAALGLPTPPHGLVRELAAAFRRSLPWGVPGAAARDVSCVVYLDELAHRGGGKQLLSLREAEALHPDAYASMFVPQQAGPAAFRLARVGRLAFWLRQLGERASWKSNAADRETVLEKQELADLGPVPRVMWAVDFIAGPSGLLALDFNTAPDLSTLGETGALTPEEVHRELARAARERPATLAQF